MPTQGLSQGPIQGTVWRFKRDTGTGSVVLDDGTRIPFDADVFLRSGLRLLRPGQRVRIEVSAGTVISLTILTLSPPG